MPKIILLEIYSLRMYAIKIYLFLTIQETQIEIQIVMWSYYRT